jgi:hypothetical protein
MFFSLVVNPLALRGTTEFLAHMHLTSGPAWPRSYVFFYELDFGQRWFPEWALLPFFYFGHLIEVVSQQDTNAR